MSFCSVAGYSLTGTVTSPKLTAPLQIARFGMGSSFPYSRVSMARTWKLGSERLPIRRRPRLPVSDAERATQSGQATACSGSSCLGRADGLVGPCDVRLLRTRKRGCRRGRTSLHWLAAEPSQKADLAAQLHTVHHS